MGGPMTTQSSVKDAGGRVLGGLMLLAMIMIPIALVYGAAELSLWALEWTPAVFQIAFLAMSLMVLLACIPASRGFAANGLIISSYVFGAILWILALAFTYDVWGLVAVVIGLLMFGIELFRSRYWQHW